MGKPIKQLSAGKIQMTLWENEYQGKKNYSVTIKKSYQKQGSKEWESTDFFTLADLRDVLVLVIKASTNAVKEKAIQAKQQPPQNNDNTQNENSHYNDNYDDDIPF